MRIDKIGDDPAVTVSTTRKGRLVKLEIRDVEIPLDYLTDVASDYSPFQTEVIGSFRGRAIIIEVPE